MNENRRRGEYHPNAKLTNKQVLEIRELIKELIKLENIDEFSRLSESYTDKGFLIGKNDKIKKI